MSRTLVETVSIPYDRGFYNELEPWASRSASRVVPIVMELLKPASVLDVGCGTGVWLRNFMDHGVSRVVGIDGDYVDRSGLHIPPGSFKAADLRKLPPDLGRFDLAICLEVAEHLPEKCAATLVSMLVHASDYVLFSAAVPGQNGTDHINLQWPCFWCSLFAEYGYNPVDIVGPKIRNDRNIEWWYRQNLLLFESQKIKGRHPEWAEFRDETGHCPLEWTHISIASRDESVRLAAERLKRVTRAAISRRVAQFLRRFRPIHPSDGASFGPKPRN